MARRQDVRFFDLENAIDYDVVIVRGRVRAFSINLRASIGGTWVPVVRYDTHHGRVHLHKFWRPTDRQVEDLEARFGRDYDEALRVAEEDLFSNWPAYRRRLEASLG